MTEAAVHDVRRTVHVEHCMGTVFTIDIRDPGGWEAAIQDVVRRLHQVDAVFSTYRDDSDISRLRRGEITAAAAEPQVIEVLALCAQVKAETAGAFSAQWDGRIDPTGLVKGWAIEQASRILRAHGSDHHAVNGGGDIQIAGESAPGRPWRVGISDPLDRSRILTVVEGRDIAVATSGTSERGEHIVDPRSGRPAHALASVTVVGRHLTRVDAYATAAFVLGEGALAWVEAQDGYEAMTVSTTGAIRSTPGFPGVTPGTR